MDLPVSGRCGHDNDRKDAVQHAAGGIEPRRGNGFLVRWRKQLALDYRAFLSLSGIRWSRAVAS